MVKRMIRKTYRNPKQPGALGGIVQLQRHAFKKTAKKKIQSALLEEEAYARHAPIRHKFTRNRIMAYGVDDCWQADLVDLSSLAESNGGYKYMLTVIDVLSKYAWIRLLKNKFGQSVLKAFQSVFKEGRRPRNLTTDEGKEFVNRNFQSFLKKLKIRFFAAVNDTKAAVAERFNRTLKTKMWRFFTANGSLRYLDAIQDLVTSYNHTEHRSIGRLRPVDVTKKNERTVWEILYRQRFPGEQLNKPKVPRFKEGDKVRISKYKGTFEKGYLPNWTSEIFTVHNVKPPGFLGSTEPMYHLRDEYDNIIVGSFYEPQMLRYGVSK